jgi:hypothetical protein
MCVALLIRIVLAAGMAVLIWRFGVLMLGGLARPVPQPPPDGELRRVNLRYRCPSCGTELRMTKTDADDPVSPRHCMDEMDLVARDGEAIDA